MSEPVARTLLVMFGMLQYGRRSRRHGYMTYLVLRPRYGCKTTHVFSAHALSQGCLPPYLPSDVTVDHHSKIGHWDLPSGSTHPAYLAQRLAGLISHHPSTASPDPGRIPNSAIQSPICHLKVGYLPISNLPTWYLPRYLPRYVGNSSHATKATYADCPTISPSPRGPCDKRLQHSAH